MMPDGSRAAEMLPAAVRSLAALLERRTGQQLDAGRRWRLETAMQPILRRHDIASLALLAARIAGNRDAALIDEVVEAMLNHETSFYRDLAAFRCLADEALPLLARRRASRRLRIWSAGCSTGQEVYSLAMLLAAAPDRWAGWAIEIVGSDISPVAIARARQGLYSQFEAQRGMPIAQLLANFTQEGAVWRIRPELRGGITYRVHNLLEPAPSPSFDLVLCRNVLLYFTPERRRQAFARLADAIAGDGLLMLGAGETVLGQTERFAPDADVRGFYRRDGPA